MEISKKKARGASVTQGPKDPMTPAQRLKVLKSTGQNVLFAAQGVGG